MAAGEGSPFFCLPGAAATPISLYLLASKITPSRPVYSFQYAGMDDAEPLQTTIDEISSRYLLEIQEIQSSGPYYIGGYCWGGLVAFDIALKLRALGESIGMLALMETIPPIVLHDRPTSSSRGDDDPASRRKLGHETQFVQAIRAIDAHMEQHLNKVPFELANQIRRVREAHNLAGLRYAGGRLDAPTTLFHTSSHVQDVFSSWPQFAIGGFETVEIPGDTFSVLTPPDVDVLGERLGGVLS